MVCVCVCVWPPAIDRWYYVPGWCYGVAYQLYLCTFVQARFCLGFRRLKAVQCV